MLVAVLRAMRPHQWVKNFFLYAPLLFSLRLFDIESLWRATFGVGLFCVLSGAIYILNDLMDVEKDWLHPHKKHRPIASGALPEASARRLWPILGGLSLGLGWIRFGFWFFVVALLYGIFNIAYSLRLKHVAYLDVLLIANGFLLRLLAGASAINVVVSAWLVGCGFLLALYLALENAATSYRLMAKVQPNNALSWSVMTSRNWIFCLGWWPRSPFWLTAAIRSIPPPSNDFKRPDQSTPSPSWSLGSCVFYS